MSIRETVVLFFFSILDNLFTIQIVKHFKSGKFVTENLCLLKFHFHRWYHQQQKI